MVTIFVMVINKMLHVLVRFVTHFAITFVVNTFVITAVRPSCQWYVRGGRV